MSAGWATHRRWAAAWAAPRWLLVFVLAVLALLLCPIPGADAAPPPPRDIVLVLDVSRSMDDAFPQVIAGLETFLADTGADDTLTLSTFGDGVKFIVRRRRLGPQAQPAVRQMLEGLAPTDRFTNITYGVDRALSELIKMGPAPGRFREVILLTDGKHNPAPGSRIPVPTFEELAQKAKRLEPAGWYIRYVVLGPEDDPDMTALVATLAGEATMLQHIRHPALATDLADVLRTPWLPTALTVEAFQGQVTLERPGEPPVPLAPGAQLHEGDRLQTGGDGYVMVLTPGEARFGLNPNSTWMVAQARRNPLTQHVRVRGTVYHGLALATAADVPTVRIALAGPRGGIQTVEGTVGVSAKVEETAVAATEAGASMLTFGVADAAAAAAAATRPVLRPPGAGPTAVPRDPFPMQAAPEPIPGGAFSTAQFVGDWSGVTSYDREWQAQFDGWRPTLETGLPLAAVPNAILVARQPPRLTDLVLTDQGEFEGDVLSDDDDMVILQTDTGLRFFPRRIVRGISFAAFPLSSGKVDDITGTAEFQRRGRGETWRALVIGTKLRPGDRIRTGPHSRVMLSIAGQAVVAVKADSLFMLADARRDNTTGDIRARVKLDAGQLWNDVGTLASPRSHYVVETPQATSGVRGTVFTVMYDRKTEETKVATVSGRVQVVEKAETLRQVEVVKERQTTIRKRVDIITETIEPATVQEWKQQEVKFEERREEMEIEYPPVRRVPVRARLQPNLVDPLRVGKRVVWTAFYPVGDGPYAYEFALRGPGTDFVWQVTQAFSTGATWEWDTRDQAGQNLVRVRVRRPNGTDIADAATVVPFTIAESYTGTVLLGLSIVWLVGLAGLVVTQLAVEPRGAASRLRVTAAPQGLPHTVLPLPDMSGLRWYHEVRMGRATGADLTLGDEHLAATQCRVRRVRFGRWMRTTLMVEPGVPVYVDGTRTEPGAHALTHMTRLRMGEYEVRFETAQPPAQYEVIRRDGHIVRGTAPKTQMLRTRVLILQPMIPGVPAYTLPFAEIEHIRCYRSPAEDDRMRGKAGGATVGGPLVRVWFEDSGDVLSGRLARAEDADRGRFRIYTDELHRLDSVIVVAAATKKIKVFPDTERPPTFTPKDQVASAKSRLALSAPGPTAVSQREIERSIERVHESRTSEDGGEATRRPAGDTESTPKPTPPAPRKKPDPPPDPPEPDRYIHRRGKPRI